MVDVPIFLAMVSGFIVLIVVTIYLVTRAIVDGDSKAGGEG